ncbi:MULTISPECIES: glycosyltransferase family 4 protein [unclassified Cyanobium]|uniref:glycosyltransferase family 4 protein n=1 Tax=unclassified Cyanobium TaxID=2627006 RepID=UPI0020CC2BCC|nr:MULTISPECIES: glycosyltransferase family 4 protein [unclassified Cyanobium]MCP9835629.1 glycosyltransferase family 4 protein [Cyanobium sp. La Preciosa 7G6]MCP9938395.1 glycosyltransferase family 4 protein [Cyanobium sp. Aljojuca 7A6]
MAPARAPSSNAGGMQRAARDLLTQLGSQDDVTLSHVVLACTKREIGWRVPLFFLALPWRLARQVWLGRADVVLFASLNPALLLPLLAPLLRRRGLRLMAIAHGLDITQGPPVAQWWIRRSLAQLDGVIGVSRATAQACLERGFPADRLQVLPNGIGQRWHSTPPVNGSVRVPPKLPGTFVCLTVGRQIPRKGFAWFVDAVMPLLPEHVQLWLVGSGPQAREIHAAIEKRDLQHRVFPLGLLEDGDLASVYQLADLFVMPNLRIHRDMEGFGLVMLEAGLHGLYCLASRIEGITDVISDANGSLLPARDAEAFSQEIQAQAALTGQQRQQQSERAAAWVQQSFGWSNLLPHYRAAIEQVLNQPRAW